MANLSPQTIAMWISLIAEGIIDGVTVTETDDFSTKPGFVNDVFSAYLQNNSERINSLEKELGKNPVDRKDIRNRLRVIRGSSVSIGAKKVTARVEEVLQLNKNGSLESVRRGYEELKEEFATFQDRIENYVELVKRTKEEKDKKLEQSDTASSSGSS